MKSNCATLPAAFAYVLRAVLTNSPNSCPPERLFSIFFSADNSLETPHDTFLSQGGTEMAVMSTTSEKEVALSYARSQKPLVFKYKTVGLNRGVSIQWLSLYPKEVEYLYPVHLSNKSVMLLTLLDFSDDNYAVSFMLMYCAASDVHQARWNPILCGGWCRDFGSGTSNVLSCTSSGVVSYYPTAIISTIMR